MIAVVYVTDNKGVQHETCRLQTVSGRVEASVGHSSGMAVLNSPLINPETGRKVTRDDGDEFLRLLPSAYSGTRLRVGLEVEGTKGDAPGHPFRGNQWSGGEGGSGDNGESGSREPLSTVAGQVHARYLGELEEKLNATIEDVTAKPSKDEVVSLTAAADELRAEYGDKFIPNNNVSQSYDGGPFRFGEQGLRRVNGLLGLLLDSDMFVVADPRVERQGGKWREF